MDHENPFLNYKPDNSSSNKYFDTCVNKFGDVSPPIWNSSSFSIETSKKDKNKIGDAMKFLQESQIDYEREQFISCETYKQLCDYNIDYYKDIVDYKPYWTPRFESSNCSYSKPSLGIRP